MKLAPPPPPLSQDTLNGHLARLIGYFDATWPGAVGPDPYDALNSSLIRSLVGSSRVGRLVATQLLRRLPVNVRPLLRTAAYRNPKTVSLLARAFLRLGASGGLEAPLAIERARLYLGWLVDDATPGYSGAAWGYSFPWQSRRLWLDRGAPSVVCTSFVAQAFIDGFELLGDRGFLSVAESAVKFILEDCPRVERGSGLCISYTPFATVAVHNANVLAAAVLAQVWRLSETSDDNLRSLSLRCSRYTLDAQTKEGAWHYDGDPDSPSRFIDGFHTGFILQGLDQVQRSLGEDFEAEIQLGLGYYRDNLFGIDHRPLRAVGRTAATDIRDCAEALLVFSMIDRSAGASESLDSVLRWTIDHLQSSDGYFYGEDIGLVLGPNRIPFPRWQAWMIYALATCLTKNSGRPLGPSIPN